MAKGIEHAIKLYERGLLIPSADALRNARMEAVSRHDQESVAETDRVADEMRVHLEADELEFFNAQLAGEAIPLDDDRVDVSPVGLALILIGALAMLIAVFLPYADATTFARVEQNSLIQHGGGWEFIV